MARLNKTESGQLMRIMNTEGWLALLKLVSMTMNDLNSRQVAGNTEFEVLRSLFMREGRVGALKEFFDDIDKGQSLSEDATRGTL